MISDHQRLILCRSNYLFISQTQIISIINNPQLFLQLFLQLNMVCHRLQPLQTVESGKHPKWSSMLVVALIYQALQRISESAGGGTRKHTFSISKSLIFITLKPCFTGLLIHSSNLLFMPVSALISQNLAPEQPRIQIQRLPLLQQHHLPRKDEFIH